MALPFQGPAPDCPLCPRLVRFRTTNRKNFPDWHNGPVASFGEMDATVLIVGLAPGLRGANCTGRPFTGDFAGDLLYATLLKYGLAEGAFGARADDGFRLLRCRVTNAVRCVPPKNRPIGAETAACRPFLTEEIAGLVHLRVIVALGVVAHGAVLAALGLRKSAMKFRHGAMHPLPDGKILADSYHCSRYNTNTGRLTEAMFHAVFAAIVENLPPP
ncbi:MAG: uracil-DNA glycosylase [Rhodospirillales bacterium]|nr:uracil-DNA glycosylase [Rhodospirillales bacterium]